MNEFSYIFLIFLLFGTSLQIWLAGRHRASVAKHKKSMPAAFAKYYYK